MIVKLKDLMRTKRYARRFIIQSPKENPTEIAGPAREKSGKKRELLYALFACLLIAGVVFIRLPQTPLEQAIQLVKTNKTAAALSILEELAQKHPEGSDYLAWLAICYLSTDRIAEGRTALDTAMKTRVPPSTVLPAVIKFSEYYRQKNDFSEAEKLLNSAQNHYPESDLKEERRVLYLSWAEDEKSKNLVREAIAHLETLAMLEGGLAEKQSHMIAELYRQQAAVEEMQEGNEEQSIKLLEKSLSFSDEPASRMALSNLYAKGNDLPHAVLHLRQLCKSDPNNLEARHKLVEISMKAGDFPGAQEAASELADREKSVENFEQLASIDIQLGNYAGAVRALEEASSLTQKDTDLLGKLEQALKDWSADLSKHNKQEESLAVKARAERVAEQLKAIQKELSQESGAKNNQNSNENWAPGSLPVALSKSRIWLSRGSLTPEGEIKLKCVGNEPLSDMALTVAFYDGTAKRRTGAVTVSAAGSSHPLLPGQSRVIYFSSPNIVKAEHQLSVLIYWKGKLMIELPVEKER